LTNSDRLNQHFRWA